MGEFSKNEIIEKLEYLDALEPLKKLISNSQQNPEIQKDGEKLSFPKNKKENLYELQELKPQETILTPLIDHDHN